MRNLIWQIGRKPATFLQILDKILNRKKYYGKLDEKHTHPCISNTRRTRYMTDSKN